MNLHFKMSQIKPNMFYRKRQTNYDSDASEQSELLFDGDSEEYYSPSTSKSSSSDSTASSDESDSNVNISRPSSSTSFDVDWKASADGNSLKNFVAPPQENCMFLQHDKSPSDYYNLFLTDEILQLIVEETNRNAIQTMAGVRMSKECRLKRWKDTHKEEIKKFLGLVLAMGIDKKPKISDYWSNNAIFKNDFFPSVMSRNRFQLLLRYIHFENNEAPTRNSRHYKVERLLEKTVRNFKSSKIPGEHLVIDESMIAFRGRLIFRQYIPGKAHKYGIKIF